MVTSIIAGVILIVIGIIVFKFELDTHGVNPKDNLRWKHNGEKYLIQRKILFILWINVYFITITGHIEKLQFDTKSQAIRYVDVHNIKKRFNQKKL